MTGVLYIECDMEELKLYQFLITIRMKLAQDKKTAPCAICGDQVIQSFAKIRPSNRESMCMIDGVNMKFIEKHSVIFLHYINEKSKELQLPMFYARYFDGRTLTRILTTESQQLHKCNLLHQLLNIRGNRADLPDTIKDAMKIEI
ncbi:unnamed protein product [Urochloa humidicola]